MWGPPQLLPNIPQLPRERLSSDVRHDTSSALAAVLLLSYAGEEAQEALAAMPLLLGSNWTTIGGLHQIVFCTES